MKYILIIAAALLIGAVWEHTATADKVHQTYLVCMAAHGEVNGDSEQRCGDMQDQTGTRFMCNEVGEYCWLEVK